MLTFIQFPNSQIPNANDGSVLHDIVKKMHATRSLWNRQCFFSLRHFPEALATPSL